MALMVLAAMAGYGLARLAAHPTTYVSGVKLRIMQPDLQQDQKFNYGAKDAVMRRYLRLSDRATGPGSKGVHDVTHLIWPESAFPFFLTREPDALAQIAALLKPGTVLITGAVRAAAEFGARPRARLQFGLCDRPRRLDPRHLRQGASGAVRRVSAVPGFARKARPAGSSPSRPAASSRASGGALMDVPGAPKMLPLICYEAIFPGDAVPRDERPGWIVNLTNDGWFGISTGPYQHFQQARVLAIAEGPAAGARRQYRHFGGHRPGRPRHQVPAARAPKACWMRACRSRSGHPHM